MMTRSRLTRPDESRGEWARRSRRMIAAFFTGGSVSAVIGLHVVHIASVAAAPAAFQFVCRLAH
jgi:hypothetical protein